MCLWMVGVVWVWVGRVLSETLKRKDVYGKRFARSIKYHFDFLDSLSYECCVLNWKHRGSLQQTILRERKRKEWTIKMSLCLFVLEYCSDTHYICWHYSNQDEWLRRKSPFFKYVRFAGAPGLSMADRARDCKREVDVQHHDNLVQALAFDSIHRRKTQQIAPVCIETRLIRTFKSTFGSIVNVKRFQGDENCISNYETGIQLNRAHEMWDNMCNVWIGCSGSIKTGWIRFVWFVRAH